ncbi:MAG: hypothetical protein JXB62_01540 [Pirellulales bacterium]|nr:hypothetical protein [Pirellulales bacterium]
MTRTNQEIDANFFNLIHQLVDSPQEDAERRKRTRRSYPAQQWIAVRRGPEIPNDSEFIEVSCYDLTRNGFSFFLPSQPDFNALVAALRTDEEVIYAGAEVVHCDDVLVDSWGRVEHVVDQALRGGAEDHSSRTATPMVLVGCRFTERLDTRPAGSGPSRPC